MSLDYAAEDVEVVLIPFGLTFQGREGFSQFMHGFKDAFPDLQITVSNQVADDDQVEFFGKAVDFSPVRLLEQKAGKRLPTSLKRPGSR